MIIAMFAFFGASFLAVLAMLIHFSWTQTDLADEAAHAEMMNPTGERS